MKEKNIHYDSNGKQFSSLQKLLSTSLLLILGILLSNCAATKPLTYSFSNVSGECTAFKLEDSSGRVHEVAGIKIAPKTGFGQGITRNLFFTENSHLTEIQASKYRQYYGKKVSIDGEISMGRSTIWSHVPVIKDVSKNKELFFRQANSQNRASTVQLKKIRTLY